MIKQHNIRHIVLLGTVLMIHSSLAEQGVTSSTGNSALQSVAKKGTSSSLSDQGSVESSQEKDARRAEFRQKWNSLSEAEKNQLRERFKTWKSLKPDEQARMRENLKNFRTLSPERRTRILEAFHRFKQLPPERQARIRERLKEFRQLPAAERRERLMKLRDRRRDTRREPRRENRLERRMERRPRGRR